MLKILEKLKVKCELVKSYIDDIRWLLQRIEKGMVWESGTKSLVFCHDKYQEDELKTDTEKTQEVVKEIMNDIYQDLKFTTESQYDYENLFFPTLDFTMSLVQKPDKTFISYQFFKKPMSSKFTICKTSALSQQVKSSTISQEFIRRLSHTSDDVDQKTRNSHIEDFIETCYKSG